MERCTRYQVHMPNIFAHALIAFLRLDPFRIASNRGAPCSSVARAASRSIITSAAVQLPSGIEEGEGSRGASLGALCVHDSTTESLERILWQGLGEDISRHEVSRLETNGDDMPLIQVANVRCPALEVFRPSGEAMRFDDINSGLIVSRLSEYPWRLLGTFLAPRSSQNRRRVNMPSLQASENTAASASALDSGTIFSALACQLTAASCRAHRGRSDHGIE